MISTPETSGINSFKFDAIASTTSSVNNAARKSILSSALSEVNSYVTIFVSGSMETLISFSWTPSSWLNASIILCSRSSIVPSNSSKSMSIVIVPVVT